MNQTAIYSHKKINYRAIFTALVISLMFPAEVYACACCATRGEWSEISQKLQSYELGEINKLRFSTIANLFITNSDKYIGLSSPSENYNLSVTKNQSRWNLQFKDKQGKTSTLTLNIPNNAVFFKTDLHDNGASPSLYKEIRLAGKVSGNGIFATGITSDTKFKLVLQGKGNNCLFAENFQTWNLKIVGSRANYSFYGKFKP
jgi:hypothetical protein